MGVLVGVRSRQEIWCKWGKGGQEDMGGKDIGGGGQEEMGGGGQDEMWGLWGRGSGGYGGRGVRRIWGEGEKIVADFNSPGVAEIAVAE